MKTISEIKEYESLVSETRTISRCVRVSESDETKYAYQIHFSPGVVCFRCVEYGVWEPDAVFNSPYASSDLPLIMCTRIDNHVIFSHPWHPPYKATRIFSGGWVFNPITL